MAGDNSGHGLPLNTFSRNVPPGWAPHNPKYPIKLYEQLMTLWLAQTPLAVPENNSQIGPVMAGRLRGMALQFALSKKNKCQNRYDPETQTYVNPHGMELLKLGTTAPTTDAEGRVVPKQSCGGDILLKNLITEFGSEEQDQNESALDAFLDFRQGHLPLLDYLQQFQHTLLRSRVSGLVQYEQRRSYSSPPQTLQSVT